MCEILAPAGDEECFSAALNSGADAIYLGLSAFSARANAQNFSFDSLAEQIKRAHILGAKVYVAMNTLVKDGEINDFIPALLKAYSLGVDSIIMQDIFLGKYIHSLYPDVTLHLSTQAGVNNVFGARLAKECGFSRVILSRETPIEEIKKITPIIETEVFVQGALCTCFSGQCYLSSFAGGNSGNRGRCKQPCRKKYSYSREGFTDMAYALSLSDLSVGERISELINAGVKSFKIEGRMRRAEYVAAAVKYYRALLSGKDGKAELSSLRRAFNRGNYTEGLAFGQDKRLLSRLVQGHMGEKVGTVTVKNKKYFVEGNFPAEKGDFFKILRGGKEVGGAAFAGNDGRGFYISSSARLLNGDGAFITTDVSENKRLLSDSGRRADLKVNVTLKVGERPRAVCEGLGIEVTGDEILSAAVTSPVTADEVISCFNKSDVFSASVNIETDGVFITKANLNALRRAFFAAAEEKLSYKHIEDYNFDGAALPKISGENKLTAAIAPYPVSADIFIFKPDDYAAADYSLLDNFKGEKYLYVPPFASSSDLELIDGKLGFFDGVYCEGTWGIVYARERGKKLFAGTGFNLTNSLAVNEVKGIAEYYALSKELTLSEQRPLTSEKSFALSAGGIKVMDLIYCPFSKMCNKCDKLNKYTLTDENGRAFPVRRYVLSGCRFEVYNCAFLTALPPHGGKLYDFSVTEKSAAFSALSAVDNVELKEIFPLHTSGHSEKGI